MSPDPCPTPAAEDAPARTDRLHTMALAGLVFAISLGASLYSLETRRQLERLQGMGEEYIDLGWDLQATGSLSPDGKWPGVFRPPGYTFFIAGVLRLCGEAPARASLGALPGRARTQLVIDAYRQVYFAQAVVLALAAALLFLWLARVTGRAAALVAGVLLGTDPYLIVCVGFLHYEVLHVGLLVAGGAALWQAFSAPRSPFGWPLAAGVILGLSTLVRPLTLPLPLVLLGVLLVAAWRRPLRPKLASWLAFALGMALAIAPWTARNYLKTGRLVPVNTQTWTSIWAGTMEKDPPDANVYQWWRLLGAGGRQIMHRVQPVGNVEYLPLAKPIEVEAAFREAALENLRERPGIYLKNAAYAFASYNADMNTSMLRFFVAYQEPSRVAGRRVKVWLGGDDADGMPAPTEARGFGLLVDALEILALCGAALALVRRNAGLVAALAVYLTIALAHAVTFVELFYYYSKLPFVIAFACYFLGEAARSRFRLKLFGLELTAVSLVGVPLLALDAVVLASLLM